MAAFPVVRKWHSIPFWLWSLMVSAVCAAIILWPLPVALHQTTIDTGDALHLAWTLYWTQETITSAAPPFYAPANHPYPMTLLLNPPLYPQALLGLPLRWLGWSPHAVYTALTLLSFTLAGWAVALLGQALCGSRGAGLVAGILYAFSDVRLIHLPHLNVLSSFWFIFLLCLVWHIWQQPDQRWQHSIGLTVGAALLISAQTLNDNYHAVFLALSMAVICTVWLGVLIWRAARGNREPARWRALAGLALAGILAVGLVWPVAGPTLTAWRELGIARPWSDHEYWSAAFAHYLQPAHDRAWYDPTTLVAADIPANPNEQLLWPGLATLTLALIGLIAGRGSARWLIALIGALAALFSLGPRQPETASLYRWLFDTVPLFSAARVPARWALLAQLSLALLAAFGAARIISVRTTFGKGWVASGFTVLLLGLAIADVRPPIVPHTEAIVNEPTPSVYAALARLPAGAILEWPIANASPVLAHRYEYYTFFHQHPIVNAAISAPPPQLAHLQQRLSQFPASDSIALLRQLGAQYVIVNRWEIGTWSSLEPQLSHAAGLRLIGRYDDGRHLLYQIVPSPAPALPALAALTVTATDVLIAVQTATPLWLDDDQQYYGRLRQFDLLIQLRNDQIITVTRELPPLLLPDQQVWVAPAAAQDAVTISIGDLTIPVVSLALTDETSTIAFTPPPPTAHPGERILCIARIAPAGDDLALAAALVDSEWNVLAKQDHHIPAGDRLASCSVTVPPNIDRTPVFLAVGLFDPAQQTFRPVIAQNQRSEGFWRMPDPIAIAPSCPPAVCPP